MAAEVWGTCAVNDHLREEAFLRELLLAPPARSEVLADAAHEVQAPPEAAVETTPRRAGSWRHRGTSSSPCWDSAPRYAIAPSMTGRARYSIQLHPTAQPQHQPAGARAAANCVEGRSTPTRGSTSAGLITQHQPEYGWAAGCGPSGGRRTARAGAADAEPCHAAPRTPRGAELRRAAGLSPISASTLAGWHQQPGAMCPPVGDPQPGLPIPVGHMSSPFRAVWKPVSKLGAPSKRDVNQAGRPTYSGGDPAPCSRGPREWGPLRRALDGAPPACVRLRMRRHPDGHEQ
jgi:hypothetical protein